GRRERDNGACSQLGGYFERTFRISVVNSWSHGAQKMASRLFMNPASISGIALYVRIPPPASHGTSILSGPERKSGDVCCASFKADLKRVGRAARFEPAGHGGIPATSRRVDSRKSPEFIPPTSSRDWGSGINSALRTLRSWVS